MKHLIAAITAPIWGVQTLHEAHQYAKHKRKFADGYRTGFERGYQAGRYDK